MIPLSGRCSCGFHTSILPGDDDVMVDYLGCRNCKKVFPFYWDIKGSSLAESRRANPISQDCQDCHAPLFDIELAPLEKKKSGILEKLFLPKPAKYVATCPACGKRELKFR